MVQLRYMGNVIIRMEYLEMNKCQEEGCQEIDTIRCRLTSYKNDIYKPSLIGFVKSYGIREGFRNIYEMLKYGYTDTFDYYCAEHCFKNGYCYGCGGFWAGSENFDFSRDHLCSNCKDDPDLVGYDEDESYYETPDEYYNYDEIDYYPEPDNTEE